MTYTWMVSGSGALTISFGQLLDPLSMTMLLVVTGVGFLIHIYSAGYMADDPGFWRFFAYLNFFIFAMVLLVLRQFRLLASRWALVGLASFLLIGFWYGKPSAVAAAQKAFVINVIGDLGLMLAIFLLFKDPHASNYPSLAFSDVFKHSPAPGRLRLSVSCSSWPVQPSRPNCRSICGCQTRWKVRHLSVR